MTDHRKSLIFEQHVWCLIWGLNTKIMNLQEVGCWGKDWVDVAQDRDCWQALVNAVMNIRFPSNAWNFSTSWETVGLSRRTLLHGVSYCKYENNNQKYFWKYMTEYFMWHLTTGPQPLPKRVPHRVRYCPALFNLQYTLLSLGSLIPTYAFFYVFPSRLSFPLAFPE